MRLKNKEMPSKREQEIKSMPGPRNLIKNCLISDTKTASRTVFTGPVPRLY